MQIEVVEEKENKFFKRKELTIKIKHENSPTPRKADVVKMLAASNSVDEDQVVIDYVFTRKGLNESVAKVKILQERPVKKEEKKEVEKSEAQASENT